MIFSINVDLTSYSLKLCYKDFLLRINGNYL